MCNCIDDIDRKLATMNTAIDWALLIDPKTGKMAERMQIKVKKADKKVRRGPAMLVPSFCPFCGEKQDNGDGL